MTAERGIDVIKRGASVEIVLLRQTPGGWLGAAQRKALIEALRLLDPAVRLVLMRSADRVMTAHPDAGPDLPSDQDGLTPRLADLCRAVEDCGVPVVVLAEGAVAGAAADLAVAARARVATPGARIAFPGVRLGRISGAGTTQRLPKLIGAEQALRLFLGGKPVGAPEALAIGLIDQIVEGETEDDILEAAQAWAEKNVSQLRISSEAANGRAYLRAVAQAKATAEPGSFELAVIDCVEAALLLPRDQGLDFEAAHSAARDALPQTGALAHMVRAERLALQTPSALRAVKPSPVLRPALVGASPSLAALALMMLARGLPVTLLETERSRLVPMLETIAARQEAAVQAGTLSAAQRDADWARLKPVIDPQEVEKADFVVVAGDAAPLGLRAGVPVLMLGRADLPQGAFRLILSGRVAELGLPANSSASAAAQSLAVLRRIGQTVVITGVQTPLGISGRLAGAGGAALRSLLTLGVAPEAIAAALIEYGVAVPNLPRPEAKAEPRQMAASEIINRWLGAMANEGARLLAAGVAGSASDIDLVAVHGLGLPAQSGGPMYQADLRGALILRRDLRLWAEEGDVWKPVPALDALVSVGRGFVQSVRRG